ncbi:MAG: TIGR01906 family membrane protein [Clostridiales bacterium]|nr:TIGR01906 family membrane protein [Clostridiales bacterium]
MTDRKKRAVNISLTVVFIVTLVLFILTFSIGLPIYCRFFYYIQIKTLDLPAQAANYGIKADYSQIKEAYDGILNFCTLPNRQFKSGIFKMSESGINHFADCKVLFDLNLAVLIVSGAISLTLILLNRFKIITFVKIKGHRAYLISAVVALALPIIIGALAAIDFDKAFEIFHGIFFPGKTNWTFDPYYDQIITVMPQEFFMNCAIIIGVGLAAFSAALIAADIILYNKDKKTATNSN